MVGAGLVVLGVLVGAGDVGLVDGVDVPGAGALRFILPLVFGLLVGVGVVVILPLDLGLVFTPFGLVYVFGVVPLLYLPGFVPIPVFGATVVPTGLPLVLGAAVGVVPL